MYIVSVRKILEDFYFSEEELPRLLSDQKFKSKKAFEKEIEIGVKELKYLSNQELLHFKLYRWRHDDYFNSKWTKQKVKINQLGVWPRMKKFSDEVCSGDLAQMAQKVKAIMDKNPQSEYFLRLKKIMRYVKIINKHLPIIALKGGVIRNSKRDFTYFKYDKCDYDIDDGNNRALALTLLGEKEINAYIGERVYTNEMLF